MSENQLINKVDGAIHLIHEVIVDGVELFEDRQTLDINDIILRMEKLKRTIEQLPESQSP
jgi:tetrahydromethanopterin S-methyltransferase subunit B